jgi:hypothetical protein
MNFLQLLRSFEELLFEVISWLLFYPRTLWRIATHPIAMANYAEREIHDKEERQFDDSISPPLFLLLSVVLAHVIELRAHALVVPAVSGIGALIMRKQDYLLFYRCVMYSTWPILAATVALTFQHRVLDRHTLRAPFFAQCFLTGPFVLAFSVGTILIRSKAEPHIYTGWMVIAVCSLWYIAVQTRWFEVSLPCNRLAAFGRASAVLLVGIGINVILALLLVAA